MSLAELELSVRATNCLESENITTVRDLVRRSEDQLLEVRNFGETTLTEVREKLARHRACAWACGCRRRRPASVDDNRDASCRRHRHHSRDQHSIERNVHDHATSTKRPQARPQSQPSAGPAAEPGQRAVPHRARRRGRRQRAQGQGPDHHHDRRRPRKSGRWSSGASRSPAARWPHQEAADELGTDAERNSDAVEGVAQERAAGSEWNQAIAPVVAARRRVPAAAWATSRPCGSCSPRSPRASPIAPGGYTRVLRLAKPRLGDAGTRAILEFVGVRDRVAPEGREADVRGQRTGRQVVGSDGRVLLSASDAGTALFCTPAMRLRRRWRSVYLSTIPAAGNRWLGRPLGHTIAASESLPSHFTETPPCCDGH